MSGGVPFGPGSREPSPSVSAVPASIPDAVLEALAVEFDPYIAKLLPEPFTADYLRHAFKYDAEIRTAAVAAVDSYHGFTCEFSPWPNQHISEYDALEQLLLQATSTPEEAYLAAEPGTRLLAYCWAAQRIEARSDETRSGSAEGESPVCEADAPNPEPQP